ELFICDQFSACLSPTMFANLWTALESVMEDFARLMRRLLEIQSGEENKSSPELIDEERLIEYLQKRHLAGRPAREQRLNTAYQHLHDWRK
ncbi:MAG TPA: hypothetical protein VL156_04040, partial [Terriglobales bacterium]|nr:hypothetical protein [Terriglobales bacterium]